MQQWRSIDTVQVKQLYISCHTSSVDQLTNVFQLLCLRDPHLSILDVHTSNINELLKPCVQQPLKTNRTCIITNLPSNELATKLQNHLRTLQLNGCSSISTSHNPLTSMYNISLQFNSAHQCQHFTHQWHHGLCPLRKTYDYKVYKSAYNHHLETYTRLQLQAVAHVYNHIRNSIATLTSYPSVHAACKTFVQSALVSPSVSWNCFINSQIPQHAFQFLHPYLVNSQKITAASMQAKSRKCKRQKQLTVLSWNITGRIVEKMQPHGSLYNCALLYEPDVILIQEHMQPLSSCPPACKLPNYKLIAWTPAFKLKHNGLCSASGRCSNGMATYVHTSAFKHFHFTQIIDHKYFQVISCQSLTSTQKSINLFNIYLRPDQYTVAYTNIINSVSKILSNNTNHILFGDFNAFPQEIERYNHKAASQHRRDKLFRSFQHTHHLKCKNINQPTLYSTSRNNETFQGVYDLCLTSQASLVISTAPVDMASLVTNPHRPLDYAISNHHVPVVTHTSLSYSSTICDIDITYAINYTVDYAISFIDKLASILPATAQFLTSVRSLLPSLSISTQSHVLTEIFKIYQLTSAAIAIQSFGVKRVSSEPSDPIWTWQHIPEVQVLLEKLQDPTLVSNDQRKQVITRQLKDVINRLHINQRQSQHMRSKIFKSDTWWREYRQHFQPRSSSISIPSELLHPSTHKLVPNIEASTSFTTDLYNMHTHDNCRRPPPEPPPPSSFSFDSDSISLAITALKIKTPDIFHLSMLQYKWGISYYSATLCQLFNIFIQFNFIPPLLKLNVNVALPKYQHNAKLVIKQDPSKYRYIGLQTSVFKIFDWILNNQLDQWQNEHHIIHESQGGFQRDRGTIEQLFLLQHTFDINSHLYLGFLDLRKAYDSVWIDGLFTRLKNYNAPKPLLNLLHLTLNNTNCINRIGTTYGTTYTRSNGLPQGAISSPLLFNLFINDLIHDLLCTDITVLNNTTICLNNLFFADDIVILARSAAELNKLIAICDSFFRTWKLCINPSKSNLLTTFDAAFSASDFKDLASTIAISSSYKYLGVPVCPLGINHNKYCKLLQQRFVSASKQMNHFCHVKNIPYIQRLTVYKSVIRSRLEYAAQIIFYDTAMITKLEKLQLTALRTLLDIPTSTPDSVILLTTNILPIKHRLHQLQFNFYIKIRNNHGTLANKVLNDMLSEPLHLKRYSNSSNPYELAIKDILQQYGHSFQHALFKHYNKLPTDLFRQLISCKLHQVDTLELLQKLEPTSSILSLIQLLSPIPDIDILLEQADKVNFVDSVDRYLHDTPFIPFFNPSVDAQYIPHEIFIHRQHIWHRILWLYSQRNAHSTCDKCLEPSNHLLLHSLFECDKQTACRQFIFDQLHQLQHDHPALAEHPLFTLIDDWYGQTHDIDTDMLDTLLSLFMMPLATPQSYSLSVQEAKIIRSLFINLCAMTLPNLHKLLQPLHWFRTDRSLLIDLEDSTQPKHIALCKLQSSQFKLCTISPLCKTNLSVDFPVFGSAAIRRKDPVLQAAATDFIQNILTKYPNQHFLWSDGAYSRSNLYASASTLVTATDQVCHSSSVTINTTNIATAELCGIIMNLTWVVQCSTHLPSIHIMCDNQYAVKACLKLYKPNLVHVPFIAAIHRTIRYLEPTTKIHFHWIPGHTNNKFHCQVDHAATQALQRHSNYTITVNKLLQNNTDALASGGACHP